MTISPDLSVQWDTAYTAYTRASGWVRDEPSNPDAAHEMARTSWEIAELWRAFTGTPGLAWWLVAALRIAAGTFDTQAVDWQDRATGIVRPSGRNGAR